MPTEAEWERAARGTTGRKYPWGHDPIDEQRANYRGRPGHPTPVGIYPLGNTPGPEPISDLAGNVWEWCKDWFQVYDEATVANPRGPERATCRLIRGGSWGSDARNCRAARRDRFLPQDRYRNLGFRVARGPSG